MQKKGVVISEIQNLGPPIIVGDEPTFNNKIESIVVKEILNDEMHPTDFDDENDNNNVSDIHFPKVAEKIKPEKDNFGEYLQKLFQTNIPPDDEPAFDNVICINNWANKIKEDQEMREVNLDRELQQIFNAEADKAIRESNANILPQMLASDKIIESTISES